MNTYEYATLPKAWRAALGCAADMSASVCIWGPDAYEIIIHQIPADEFPAYLHLKWFLYELGEMLTDLFKA